MTSKEDALCEHVSVSLKEYFEVKLKAVQDATELARKDMDRRLGELNELRKQVIEDRGQFVTKDAYDATEKEKGQWRELVTTRLTAIETRSLTWTAAVGVLFTFIQVAFYFLLHK